MAVTATTPAQFELILPFFKGVAIPLGVIGFIGLVVPHLIRIVAGSDHRVVLPASALAGGILLVLADTLDEPVIRCDALLAKAEYESAGNNLDALPYAEQAASLARQINNPVKEGQALLAIAQVYRYSDNHTQARTNLEAAIALFMENECPSLASAGLHTLSLVLQATGEKELAMKSVEEALRLSRRFMR